MVPSLLSEGGGSREEVNAEFGMRNDSENFSFLF